MKIEIFLVALVSLYFCFYSLGERPFSLWDESVNVQVIKESLSSENPFLLRLNNQPFFEKPPLWYYLTFIPVKLLGFNTFSLRFISAVSGFFIIIFSYFIAVKLYSRFAGVVTVLVILSTKHLFFINPGGVFATHNFRSADVDSLMILFMMLSYYFYYLTVKGKSKALIYASLFTGLSVLTKGLIGIIPTIVFLIYVYIFNKKINLKLLYFSIIIFLLVVIPWHMIMSLKYGSTFINQYFFYHLIQRVSSPLEGHQEPLFFYLLILFNKKIFLGLELLIISFIYFLIKKDRGVDYKNFSLMGLVLLIFIVATFTQTKLSWYILPIYPFSAILISGFISDLLVPE